MYHNAYCDKNTEPSPKNLFYKFTEKKKKKNPAKFTDDTYSVGASGSDLVQRKSVKN